MTDNLPAIHSATADALALVEPAGALAERLARSAFVPVAFRGKPDELLACILTGHEMGLAPMAALRGIHVIEGRPSISAELMRAMVLRAGHDVWTEEASGSRVTLCGRRAGSSEVTRVTWTLDDARRANLAGKQNWTRYPRAMLLARATSELVRLLFPDVVSIGYTPDEVASGEDVAGGFDPVAAEVVPDAPAAPSGATRTPPKGARKAAPLTVVPDPEPEPAPGVDDDVVDAEVVEDDEPDATPGDAGPTARDLAIAARKAGLDDVRRHALAGLVSNGPPCSTKALTVEQRIACGAYVEMIGDGSAELVHDGDGWALIVDGVPELVQPGPALDVEPEVEQFPDDDAPPAPALDGPPPDAAGWKALLDDHGIRLAAAIRQAQQIAAELGATPPSNLAALVDADPALVDSLLAWVGAQ